MLQSMVASLAPPTHHSLQLSWDPPVVVVHLLGHQYLARNGSSVWSWPDMLAAWSSSSSISMQMMAGIWCRYSIAPVSSLMHSPASVLTHYVKDYSCQVQVLVPIFSPLLSKRLGDFHPSGTARIKTFICSSKIWAKDMWIFIQLGTNLNMCTFQRCLRPIW